MEGFQLLILMEKLVFIMKIARLSTEILKVKKDFRQNFEESRICHLFFDDIHYEFV